MRRWAWLALFPGALAGCSAAEEERAPSDVARLELTAFTVAPGEEGLMCQTFANPFDGDVDIAAWRAQLAEGGHHMLVFQVPDVPPAALAPCAPNDGRLPMVFQGQQVGASTLEYPGDIAALLPAGDALVVQVHYQNPTDHDLVVTNAVELRRAAAGADLAHVASLKLETFDISVPPGGVPTTVAKTCRLEDSIRVVWLTSHMHSHGTGFRATTAEASLYETAEWHDPPLRVFDPPADLAAGDEIAFACTYANHGDDQVTFGLSLEDDEMCVLVGGYVRADGADGAAIACGDDSDGGCLGCVAALTQQKPEALCTDDGTPSSKDVYDALQACSCGDDGCRDDCADSACAGQPPSDACFACLGAVCKTQSDACFGA